MVIVDRSEQNDEVGVVIIILVSNKKHYYYYYYYYLPRGRWYEPS